MIFDAHSSLRTAALWIPSPWFLSSHDFPLCLEWLLLSVFVLFCFIYLFIYLFQISGAELYASFTHVYSPMFFML